MGKELNDKIDINLTMGEEYATNEYINGQRVYRLRKSLGNLGNSARVIFDTGLSSTYQVVDAKFYAVQSNETLLIPFIGLNGSDYVAAHPNDNAKSIVTQCNFDAHAWTFVVDMKYIKS